MKPLPAQQTPEENHESAVGKNEIGPGHRAAVVFIALQSAKTGAGGGNDQATLFQGAVDRRRDGAVEEIEAEDEHGRK